MKHNDNRGDAGLEAYRRKWNRHYTSGRGFNLLPAKLLVEVVEGESPGRALDLGMGQGRNALFLATRGWDVTGVDIADEGLRIARQTAEQQGLALRAIHQDIDRFDLTQETWDLVTMIYMGKDVDVVKRILASLRHNGLFVCEYFHADSKFSAGSGGWRTGELAEVVGNGFEVLRDEVVEDQVDWANRCRTMLVRFVARRS